MESRIRRAALGNLPLDELSPEEQAVANAMINESISAAAAGTSFADQLAARGITTIVMDDDGRMVRRHPDGSSTPV